MRILGVACLFLTFCASIPDASLPKREAPPPVETPVEAEQSSEAIELKGPVTVIQSTATLLAQRALSQKSEVRQLRLSQQGELQTLAVKDVVLPLAPPFELALSAIAYYRDVLGLANVSNLQDRFVLERTLEEGTLLHLRLRQIYSGIAVEDRTIDLHFDMSSDAARLIHLTGAPAKLDGLTATATIDAATATTSVRTRVPQDIQVELTQVLRMFRTKDGTYRLAYRVDAQTADHGFSRSFFVDAKDGALLEELDRVAHGHVEASVFAHNSAHSAKSWLPVANLRVSDTAVTNANGEHSAAGNITFRLKGPFVEAVDEDAQPYEYSGSGNVRLEFDRFDARNSALAVFVHVNRMHDYFKSTFGFDKLDGGIKAYVHSEECLFNAYASGTSFLRFGDGCGLYDYAQSADYVFHEYTHLVTNSLVDVDYSTRNEAGAYSEGNSDYFACSALDDDVWGENPVGVFERPCNNEQRYDREYSGESHSGAPIFSGSVWELRKQFGKAIADRLAYDAMLFMPKHPALIDTRDAILAADRAKFAGIHEAEIKAAFDKHGINDKLQVFITASNWMPKGFPFEAVVTAHAQGFEQSTIQYHWEFGDGTTATGDEVVHTFQKKQATAKVTVTDAKGTSLFAQINIKGCNAGGDSLLWPLLLALGGLVLRRRPERS